MRHRGRGYNRGVTLERLPHTVVRTSSGACLVFPKPSLPCTKSAMRSLAVPSSVVREPSATGSSANPAISRSLMALRVASGVRTLPNKVVSPMTSSSGELNAARIAHASSMPARVGCADWVGRVARSDRALGRMTGATLYLDRCL